MNGALASIAAAAPAIAMLGVFACLIGGGAMVARPQRDTRKDVLLLVMAAVLLGMSWFGRCEGGANGFYNT